MNLFMIVGSAALLMILIERVRPGRAFEQAKAWWPRAVALNSFQALSTWFGAMTWDIWLSKVRLSDFSALTLLSQVLLGYLVLTFIYYWWHRARHQVPFLWRWLHQIHHSPVRLEIITSFYKHPMEIVANGVLSSFILTSLLGLSVSATVIVVLLTGLAELFYHWNVKTPYWLGFIIQRPESHCVHHLRGRHKNNYSDLPIWDILFGTFENPKDQPKRCGFGNEKELRLVDMLKGRDVYEA